VGDGAADLPHAVDELGEPVEHDGEIGGKPVEFVAGTRAL
jgi:hypothetical protein